MRSVKVMEFVKEGLENLKDELDFKSESEVIYYLLQIYYTRKAEITLMEHIEYRQTYKVEREVEVSRGNEEEYEEKEENDG
ncbi:hypothetical protein [Paenibacillus alvei]|uniref:hypothetical protein n=1 Tax=Paenibacillus alvei TaxID=44250 RepID=UPI001657279E|nr:hypothetical protein [Paenibacillus alvei]MCY9543473.1 hypothetical protein [Paenibacillus alvei]MEC0082253.1 hypothetical protein [Paenibacillus alvei]